MDGNRVIARPKGPIASLGVIAVLTSLLAGMSAAPIADASQGQAIVEEAAKWAGTPYCWDGGNQNGPTGGTTDPENGLRCGVGGYEPPGTAGFDCTGLTLYAVYQATGILLPHGVGQDTGHGGVPVARSELQPGDLVFFGPTLASYTHAGVYAGNGEMWDAQNEYVPVQKHHLYSNYVGATRYWHTVPEEPPPPQTTEANLLRDGGFESGGLGWGVLGPGSVNYTSYASSSAHDGQRFEESNTTASGGSLYQDVPVNMQQGQSATFSIWARLAPGTTASGQSVTLCLWALSGGNVAACQNEVLTTSWQQLQATATMPAATGMLRAQLYESTPGVNYDFDGGSLGAPQTADPPHAASTPSAQGATVTTVTPSSHSTPAAGVLGVHALVRRCVVPKLRNLTLTQARIRLRCAHCRLGSVRRGSGARGAARLRVSRQSSKPRGIHRDNFTVNVVLSRAR